MEQSIQRELQIYVNEHFIQSVHLQLASGLPRQRVIRQPATGSV